MILTVHISVKEFGRFTGIVEHVLGWQTLRLTDVPDLIVLRTTGVQGPTQKQFRNNATERPHINGLAKR